MTPVAFAFVLILAIAATGYFLGNQTIVGGVHYAEGILSGNLLSASQIATIAANAGFTGADLQTAVAIALAESSGNPTIVGDKNLAPDRGPSIGLWQINIGTKAHPEYAGADLTDPAVNASAAFTIFSEFGWVQWATYSVQPPRYLAFMPDAAAAVEGLSA